MKLERKKAMARSERKLMKRNKQVESLEALVNVIIKAEEIIHVLNYILYLEIVFI